MLEICKYELIPDKVWYVLAAKLDVKYKLIPAIVWNVEFAVVVNK